MPGGRHSRAGNRFRVGFGARARGNLRRSADSDRPNPRSRLTGMRVARAARSGRSSASVVHPTALARSGRRSDLLAGQFPQKDNCGDHGFHPSPPINRACDCGSNNDSGDFTHVASTISSRHSFRNARQLIAFPSGIIQAEAKAKLGSKSRRQNCTLPIK